MFFYVAIDFFYLLTYLNIENNSLFNSMLNLKFKIKKKCTFAF
jgi:hypothetical protein